MQGDVTLHHPKEGAVLGFPPILLLSAQSRRERILSEWPKIAQSPDERMESISPTRIPQSIW
jgi:hypothetical protein